MMFELRTIVGGVATLSFLTFITLFGQVPALRNTPVGLLHRLIWVHVPQRVRHADACLTGGRLGPLCLGVGHHLMNEKHPLILTFFLTLLVACEVIYLPSAWSRVSAIHHWLIPPLCAIPYLTIYLAVTSDPGVITPANHAAAMRLYPYDYIMFRPGLRCVTCNLLKPARSKHCRICKRCISRDDHHCVWINNCVGGGNHHYFLLVLLSTSVLATYAACVTQALLSDLLASSSPLPRHRAPSDGGSRAVPSAMSAHWSAGLSWSDYANAWGWAVVQDTRVGTVGLLCLLCAPLAWGLLLFHLYLIWAGTTTNESAKWADWKDDIADGLVFKAKRSRIEELARGGRSSAMSPDDEFQAPLVNWPRSTDQILQVNESGHPPSSPGQVGGGRGDASPWTPVKSLREVDNIYDLGFWANLKDIFLSRGGWG
ncbi:MAG: palmitoyltransferase swf1 [Thelocarpon superellum]|nr:MAG: palmitoyltransferase swf1 [Thelocarpon superellum]